MKKKTKWITIGAGITALATAAAGVAAVISRKISKYVVDSALNREKPKAIKGTKKNDYSKISPELQKKLAVMAEKLKNSDCETVEIKARDGEKLVGHWYHKEGDTRVIIAMHGWRSSWTHDFCAISDFWKNNRCSVLYVEKRGQGESGGKYMGFGMIERYDCLEWIEWENDKINESLPIYLAGISMGASTVLMASGFDLPNNVNGIIADCGFTSADAIWKHVVEDSTPISYKSRRNTVDRLCKKKIQMGAREYTTLDAMKDCNVPILFIHGTDDKFVPIEMTYENYKACTSPKKLFVVPGATHAMSYIVDKAGYEKTVKEFWEMYDISI